MTQQPQDKVLIIDDDSRNIFALNAVLKARGFKTVTAVGARDGIELLMTDKSIGVVLLDMMMPEIDGYEAIRIIKDKGIQTPIISVTAQAMVDDREKCIEAGADEYLSKPVDVDALLKLLRLYLKGNG